MRTFKFCRLTKMSRNLKLNLKTLIRQSVSLKGLGGPMKAPLQGYRT